MKRRGFLKMLGIGAAVPAMAQIPAKAEPQVIGMDVSAAGLTIGPMIKIAAPDGSYIYGAANPADWFDANGNQKRALYKIPKRTAYVERDSIGQLVTVRIEES